MGQATIKEVAKRSGVGIGTVSRVMNNSPQISEKTREKVMKAIKELNYVPNVAGKRLSQKRSNVIAVIVPVINHPYFAKLIEELELEADLHGYSLLVASSQHRIEKEKEILKRIAQGEADGALFVTHYEHNPEEFKNLAIVSIDRHLGGDIPIVTTNNYEGTAAGVRFLIAHGSKNIAFIGTRPSEASEVSLREKAYRDVMEDNHLEPFVINKNVSHGEEKKIVDELFSSGKHFDGVFVSGCILATVLYDEIKDRDIRMPTELQIISYDGQFSIDNHTFITCLEQPLDLMAKKCVELLIEIIEGKKVERINRFDCRFVVGETTKQEENL